MASDSSSSSGKQRRFVWFAWVATAYTLLVVLFGAVVRITGSGAGCGQHWPTCHGEVAHLPESVETWIELTHRLTSGLCLVLVLVLWIWAAKVFKRGHSARRYAVWVFWLMVLEALVGASLVLLQLVGANASASRAVFMAVHLVSTSALMGALILTAWTAARSEELAAFRLKVFDRLSLGLGWALGALVAVSMLGAITALGDTLYPVEPGVNLAERLGGSHFLERLRIAHPVSAVLFAGWLWWLSGRFEAFEPLGKPLSQRTKRSMGSAQEPLEAASAASAGGAEELGSPRTIGEDWECVRWSRWVKGLLGLQLVVGVVNVALSAPGYMQVIHLALATVLWSTVVLLFASYIAQTRLRSGAASGDGSQAQGKLS